MLFCTRGRLMSERLWQTALADHCINKPLKNLHWSYWRLIWRQNCFDLYHWARAPGRSEKFYSLLTSLKIKVALYPIIVSLDTLTSTKPMLNLLWHKKNSFFSQKINYMSMYSVRVWWCAWGLLTAQFAINEECVIWKKKLEKERKKEKKSCNQHNQKKFEQLCPGQSEKTKAPFCHSEDIMEN